MKNLLVAALLLTTAGACSPVRIESTTQTPGVDFSAYKTYNFLDVTARNEAAFAGGGVGIEELKQAVARELESRGYQRADTPDLWVNIGIVTEEKVQTRETNIQFDGPRYIGQRRYRWEKQQVPVGTYREGTATVDIVDAARNLQIWQGVAASTLTKDPARLAARIDEGIATMFEKYPVQPR
ncbi:DUF4136 domain-containing protein [Hymenobacter sp. 5516J-16]|uniref:DUF4136 domain-containing protein n=1 Tax=Hymenobacter sublimis TaxID=2933777 RepID=A0ABY4J502_9BACT|nr:MULTISPECIES: DUF4136 domain-containing protein [Hymenobacter]UOQ77935.1 DUF4136 domain-containing protein [Hymenobacter sp. 5516J-16]UPL47918.1 DUF4136 domain-containing protein [Hymenobacter sublimis]